MPEPVAQGVVDWMKQQSLRTEAQDLRPRGIGPVRYGTLTNFTNGVMSVTMQDDSSIVTVGAWSADYTPTSGDLVAVIPWKPNTGQVYVMNKINVTKPALLPTPLALNVGLGNHATYYVGSWVKTADGIVMLQGAVVNTSGATWPAGKALATLPEDARPDHDLVFNMNYYGGNGSSITVRANGDIFPNQSFSVTDSQYWTLGNIAFPAAGVADWTYYDDAGSGMSLQNGYTPRLTDTVGTTVLDYGKPRVWVDGYGFAWVQGCMNVGTTTADDTPMLQLPTSLRSQYMNHCISTANFVSMALLGTGQPAGQSAAPCITWKTGRASSGWVSLSPLTGYELASAAASHTWSAFPAAGGWSAYPGFTPPGSIVLPNLMVRLRGLLAGPAGTAQIGTLAAGTRGTQDFAKTAGNPSARAAVNNLAHIENNPNGGIWETAVAAGNNAWFSFDIQQFALGG